MVTERGREKKSCGQKTFVLFCSRTNTIYRLPNTSPAPFPEHDRRPFREVGAWLQANSKS
ncbi:hypothetical protein EYF80_055288 [Liparis tanakae]|uniref:Uncharacterized protein n=1 Tax=Liparis tanakae TaxID=230148 RepID=A0A4Z2F1A8_9TELE|nr:hypothetical protein EYF80_055288 [Liparis tanakae]